MLKVEAREVKQKPDKTEKAFRVLSDLKQKKSRGRIVLFLDGSGKVAEFEVTEKY